MNKHAIVNDTKESYKQSSSFNSSLSTSSSIVKAVDKYANPITIRLAKPSDLPDIVAIYNQSICTKLSTADLSPVTVADRQPWFDDHYSNSCRPIYVVKNKAGKLMAWGSFSNVNSRFAYHISSEISIYVSNLFYRHGIASVLLDYMLHQATSLGIKNVIALIFAHNKPSIALFSKFGFEQWGLMPNICDMGEFYADVVTMGKQIAASTN